MNNYLPTAVSKGKTFDAELSHILSTGSAKEKEHALLNVALSGENNEKALDLFLIYIKDQQIETVAYMCLQKLLENSIHFSLLKVLPVLIAGLNHEKEAIRYSCQSGLDSLVKPVSQKEGTLAFGTIPLLLKQSSIKEYLETKSAEKIITALLCIFYRPHNDAELFAILEKQLTKNLPAVNCIVGAIIDVKLSAIIKNMSALSELSLKSYAMAQNNRLKSKSSWVYRRFDSIRELAREHLSVMKGGVEDK